MNDSGGSVACAAIVPRAPSAATAQTIKADLGLDDGQLGLLQGLVFASLYSVLGLPVGWLAERVNRVRIIAVSVGVWSTMTLLCGRVHSFPQIFLARAGVGVGEAGYMAPTNSLAAGGDGRPCAPSPATPSSSRPGARSSGGKVSRASRLSTR